MARIFITGSADGLGQLSAKWLVSHGHKVVLHARNEERSRDAIRKVAGAEAVLTGDLSSIGETKTLAEKLNQSGGFDVVIHNAGVYQAPAQQIFAVNTLAPYILTCSMQKAKRLIYLSSGMHLQGKPAFENFSAHAGVRYADSKLHVLMLSKAVARRWQDVYANAVDPGWVPTKMGGHGAPDDLNKGFETQVWLAVSNDEKAKVSGCYFYHQKQRAYNPIANDIDLQEKFLDACRKITGVELPQ